MERRQLLALGGAGLSASALAGWATVGSADSPEPSTPPVAQQAQRTLTVDATGAVSTEPDQAELSVTIEATDSDEADAVVSTLARQSDQLLEDLATAGIADDAITTTRYRLRESSRRNQYEGYHRYRITLPDHERAGEIIDVVAASTADEINGVTFTISSERRDELYDEAIDKAVTTAREEARRYADAAAVDLDGPLDIETTQTSVSPHDGQYELALEATDDAPTELTSGQVDVTASVTITYRITSPTA